jgi:hypothetical protein
VHLQNFGCFDLWQIQQGAKRATMDPQNGLFGGSRPSFFFVLKHQFFEIDDNYHKT